MTIRLVCPACKDPDGLWATATFEGWHSVDAVLEGTRTRLQTCRRGHPYREVDCSDLIEVDHAGAIGCSCGWEGCRDDLIQLGTDGQPLSRLHPKQEAMSL